VQNQRRIQSRRVVVAGLGLFVGLSAASAASAAEVLLIDLNENNGSGGPGGTWNTFAAPANINGGTLVNSANVATTVTLSVASGSSISDNTANFGTNVFDPALSGFVNQPAWVAAGGNNQAAGDNFFTNNTAAGTQAFTLVFGNLPATGTVSIDLLAARNSTAALGFFEYSTDGGTTWAGYRVMNSDDTVATTNGWDTNNTQSQAFSLQTQGYNLHRYMNAVDVPLDSGSLSIRTTDGNSTTSTFSAVNAIRLTVVPEPTSIATAAGGLLVASAARRRRNRA
jgi:hypothetical protein